MPNKYMRVRIAVLAVLAAATTTAIAQTAPPPKVAAGDELQEIVVTGSLIARPAAETAEVVTIVKAETLKDMGITTVEQALSELTSNVAAVTTQSSVASFSGAASFANLRGLGSSKTLVLLDGQRLANNVTFGYAVDLNTIPFSAIDHIEVLHEGASSLYGSDAIAGVINFITKKDYTSGEVNIDFNRPQQSGGGSGNVDLTWGMGNLASDGYNLLFAANYTKQQELRATQRSFSATGWDPAASLTNQNGPEGPWPGSYFDNSKPANEYQVGYPACAGNPFLQRFDGYCAYEYSAAVDLIPKSNIASGLIEFTKALPGNNTLSIQAYVARFQTTLWSGPQEYAFTMDPSSPYYPTAAESSPMFGAPATPTLTGPIGIGWTDPVNNRFFGDTNTETRILTTFAGENAGWNYATSFDYSVNRNTFSSMGGFPDVAIFAPGNVLSPLVNPFGPQSVAGQAFINSTYLDGNLASGYLSLYSINGHASHELGDALNAGRPATFAIGFDARVEQIGYRPTELATLLRGSTYYPPQSIVGSRNAQALYAELNVPVTKEFEVTISDRQDRYSDFGDTNNAKLSLRYQPLTELTFRAAASTGFRAPSLVDLYAPDVFGAAAGTMNGPGCPAGSGAIFTASNCAAQGLALSGGNANLKPETSQNIDVGVIFSPVQNLDFSLDYYHILLKNEIQAIPDVAIYGNPTTFANYYVLNNQGSLTQAPSQAESCGGGTAYNTPTCGYIIQTLQNTGGITTGGIDLSANYTMATDFGKFRVHLDGTLVTQYQIQEYPGGPELNLVGQFNSGNQPVIRWQHILSLDWSNGAWGAGIENHFVDRYVDEFPNAAGNEQMVGSYSLFNGHVSWKPIEQLTTIFGIRNIMDRNPPLSNQYQNWQAGYNPLFSDPLMRTFYVQLKYDF